MGVITKYPKCFIEAVKQIYPNDTMIHEIAESGDYLMGQLLQDSIQYITYTEILEAKSLKELQEKVNKINKQQELYQYWYDYLRVKD